MFRGSSKAFVKDIQKPAAVCRKGFSLVNFIYEKGIGMKHKRSRIAVIAAAFLAVIAALTVVTYFFVQNFARSIIIKNVDELAEHDMLIIKEYVAAKTNDMNCMLDELEIVAPENESALRDEIKLKEQVGVFSRIYLLAADGSLYSSEGIKPAEQNVFLGYFSENQNAEFVRRYNDTEEQKAYLIYGIGFKNAPMTFAGTDFIGMAVLNDISIIRSKLSITCFGGKGYSSVINSNGEYIVNSDVSTDVFDPENFFELTVDAEYKEQISADEVKDKINSREEFSFSYVRKDGEERFVSVKPILDSNWLFINSISDSVFEAQTSRFLLFTVGIMSAVAAVMIIGIFVIHQMRKKLKNFYSSTVKGVYSRNYYNDKLVYQTVNSVVLLDLDKLKYINDNFGHLAGDQAIRKTAEVLYSVLGDIGDVVRFGGDEFVVGISADISYDEFRARLDRVLEVMKGVKIEKYPDVKLSASIGGYYGEGITGDIFCYADYMLYRAKKDRNCVVTETADEEKSRSKEEKLKSGITSN